MLCLLGKNRIQLLSLVTSMVVIMCTLVSGLKSGIRSTGSAARLITRRNLNRVLCEQEEVQHSIDDDCILLSLKKEDFRANHINKILKLKVGDNIRGGIVDVGMTNSGTIEEVGDTVRINLGKKSDLYLTPRPSVDLILAVPRPRRLELLLPMISCLGIRNLFLIQARKVDKDYFGSHLLRTPAAMRTLLVEGLAQAEVDCHLPQVHIKRNLREFLTKELDTHVPLGESYRLITHPPLQSYNINRVAPPPNDPGTASMPVEHLQSEYVKSKDSLRFGEYMQHLRHLRACSIQQLMEPSHSSSGSSSSSGSKTNAVAEKDNSKSKGMVIAVGPEGGWDAEEVELFQQRGFQLVNLGPRILRTDIAVPVLLGLAHEHLSGAK